MSVFSVQWRIRKVSLLGRGGRSQGWDGLVLWLIERRNRLKRQHGMSPDFLIKERREGEREWRYLTQLMTPRVYWAPNGDFRPFLSLSVQSPQSCDLSDEERRERRRTVCYFKMTYFYLLSLSLSPHKIQNMRRVKQMVESEGNDYIWRSDRLSCVLPL